jgi:FAD/FMN-containing dehydrogenase
VTSLFSFLRAEWPDVYEAADRAAQVAHPDPRTACFYARRALELAVAWAYKADPALHLPYQDSLSALIHEPSFKAAAGEAVFGKARVIRSAARWRWTCLASPRRMASSASGPRHARSSGSTPTT